MGSYTSHPVDKFKIGRFQFERGVLNLDEKDSKEFDELLAAQPISVSRKVKKLDSSMADQIAKAFQRGRMSQGVDTTANSVEALDPNRSATALEKDAGLEHANLRHPGASKDKLTDGNAEPEFGPEQDLIDPFDGDNERRLERNNPVEMSRQVAGNTTGSDQHATGESVAQEETAKNEATGRVMGTVFKKPNPDAGEQLDKDEFKKADESKAEGAPFKLGNRDSDGQ